MSGFDLASWLAQTTGVGNAPAKETPSPAAPAAVQSSVGPTSVHGASALAAAVVAGDQAPVKPGPDGVELKPGGDTFDIDAIRKYSLPQLQVAPITMVKNDCKLQVVHQIATNSSYICYALKAGQIRVLNKSTTNRTLLKGHNITVTDMKFCNVVQASNILASCDSAGELYVRKIVEDSPDAPIVEEVLVHHKFSMSDKATKRLAWHPENEGLLAVAANDRVSLVNVPPTSGVAVSAEFASPVAPDSPVTEGCITSVAFNEAGDLLAAADDKGFVFVWALSPHELASAEEGGQTLQPLSAEPDIMFRAYEGEDYAATLDFLPSKSQKSVLVTGNCTAHILKLWNVHIEDKPCCTYTLELTSSKEGPSAFFNHMLVQPQFSVVVLANTKRQQVYVLHAKQDEHTDLTSFDYLSDFSVVQSILSMTTTTEPSYEDGEPVFHLYCVQPQAIQQYTLYPEICFPREATAMQNEGARAPGPESATMEAASSDAVTADSSLDTPLQPRLLSPSALLQESLERSKSDTALEPAAVETAKAMPLTEEVLSGAAGTGAARSYPLTLSSATSDAAGAEHVEDDADATISTAAASTAPPAAEPLPAASPALAEVVTESKSTSSHEAPTMPPPPSDLLKKRMGGSTPAASSASASTAAAKPSSNNFTAATAAAMTAAPAVSRTPPKQNKNKGGSAAPMPPPPSSGLATAAGVTVSSKAAPAPAATAADATLLQPNGDSESDLKSLLKNQQALLNQMVVSQAEVIKQMKADMAKQAKATETAITKAVDAAIKAQTKAQEDARAREMKKEKDEMNKMLQQMSSSLLKDVTNRVQEAHRNSASSILNAVVPAVSKAVADAIPGALGSGGTQQALERALSTQLRSSLPRAVSDGVCEAFTAGGIAASFESAAKVMFSQIDMTFRMGLTEQLQKSSGATSDIAASMKDSAEQMSKLVRQMTSGPASSGPGAAGALSVTDLEARGRPPPPDPKSQITAFLSHQQYEQAFNAALTTLDVATTLWLCKQMDPAKLFAIEPVPLSQVVLLSLITHLGQDLKTDTDVKLAWICEAAPMLDPKGQHFVLHARSLLEPIKLQLTALAKSSSGETGRAAKTTVHLVNSLLHQ